MAWRLARSLDVLRTQINELSPNRSKISDGTKGDDAHARRKSDHNPNARGVVQGMDITDDEKHGVDNVKLANALIASRDRRIKYLIADGQICSGAAGPAPWTWRSYTGSNAHRHHMHISVADDPKLYDDASAWDLPGFSVSSSKQTASVSRPASPVLSRGAKGADVERLQMLLNAKGAALVLDGDFGERTEKAVVAFQRSGKLLPDGRVGPYTWDALNS